MSSSDGALVLRTLAEANVQFVMVGEPDAGGVLRLVVSRHPTNLEALGRALDALGSTLRSAAGEVPPEESSPGEERAGKAPAGEAPAGEAPPAELHRVGDPSGTVGVRTAGGDVDLVFGGAHRSLYADMVQRAEDRDVGGTTVRWSENLVPAEPLVRATGRALGRRLLSIADDLAQLVGLERADGPHGEGFEGDQAQSGDRPPTEQSRRAGGAESNGEPGSTG